MASPAAPLPGSDADGLPLAHARELAAIRPPDWPRYVTGVGIASFGIMIVVSVGTSSFEWVMAIPVIAVLAYISYRIGKRIAAGARDPSLAALVFAAFWAKLMGTFVRVLVVSVFYDNRSDANDYHLYGKALAPMFRGFDFDRAPGWTGTDFMRSMTGVLYSFTGVSQVSGAIVLSFLSFVGLLLLWRAFARAVPNGNHRRYGMLVLFLPSFLYWPSALGKEGWAILCLGIASYGVACVVTGNLPIGAVLFSLGMSGVTFLRPHIALTIFCGVALAGVVGKSQRPSGKTPILRLLLFGGLLVLGFALASSTAEFFGVPALTSETVDATLNEAEGRTSEAGSAFSPVSVSSNPANAPAALVTVLFRPLPFEASNGVAAASAMEGVFFIVLVFTSRRRLRSIPRSMRRQPYVAYCVGILLTFIYAFSSFSNFGILARQRCQVLPFFLALLCLPEWTREGVISPEEALAGRDAPAEPLLKDADPTPDAAVGAAPSFDPYEEAELEWDPYRRFRHTDDPYGRGG